VLTDLSDIRNRIASKKSDESILQYRRLAQYHTPASLSLEQEISADFSATCVMLYLKNLDARTLIAFDQKVRAWLDRHLSPFAYQGGTGVSLTFAHLGQRNASTMVYSLGIALAAIAMIAGLILRSVNAIWIGLVCNIFPVIMVYSVWALAGGHISIGGAIVMGMILGIVVDDTIYLLAKYANARRCGDDDPVAGSLRQVGPALIITTITLCAGLTVGLLSDFGPILTMSGLSVAIILLALITDLLVLPSLLRLVDKQRSGYATSYGHSP
jgi:predicted RND superfamily exporter protein